MALTTDIRLLKTEVQFFARNFSQRLAAGFCELENLDTEIGILLKIAQCLEKIGEKMRK